MIQSKLGTAAVCFLASSLVTAACTSTRLANSEGRMITATSRVESDPSLERGLSLLDPRFESVNGAVVAAFSLRLETGRELDLVVHVDWFDAFGRPLAASSEVWVPVHLVHGTAQPLRVSPPASDARSFRLRFQRPEAVL